MREQWLGCWITSALLVGPACASPPRPECPVTPATEVLPAVAPMAGAHPVWVVSTAGGAWCCADCPVKTLWISARSVQGDLVIRGRALDGPGEALLERGDGPPLVELVISAAGAASGVTPGGADPSLSQAYAFWPSYVYYPRPGCWELVADFAGQRVRIVQYLADQSSSAWCEGRDGQARGPLGGGD